MQTADVVVIGGGIVGSSIAWHLTNAGCKSVLVIERESSQGKGSTGKSMGGVRAQFSTPVNIQMSLYSIPFYASFDERLGYPCGYRSQGYLFCATSEDHLAYLRTNYETQVRLGLETARLVTGEDIRKMFPQLRSDDILGGAFCSTDGFVDPYIAMTGFMSCASEHGAELWKNTLVTGIQRDAQGIIGVETNKGASQYSNRREPAGPGPQASQKWPRFTRAPLRRMLVTEPSLTPAYCTHDRRHVHWISFSP
jgi:sarcosine oxidase subunit beta